MLAARPGDVLDFTTAVRPPRTAVDTVAADDRKLSGSKRRHQQKRIAEARAEIAVRLANGTRGVIAPMPTPRYDDVFFEGTALLDAAAGEPVTKSEGPVEFDDSVWASAQRRDTDVS
jgi:hypothetical protein